MKKPLNDAVTDKWKQISIEFYSSVPPTYDVNIFKGRIPVSGILYCTSQSSFGIIVSALPWQCTETSRWKASGIHENICSFDVPCRSLLKFKESSCEPIHVHPFVDEVNRGVLHASFAPKQIPAVKASKDDITADDFSITGICYERQKRTDTSMESFRFCKWEQYRPWPCCSKDEFASFLVKIEKGMRSSFWGAPILTAEGKIKSIVVYQQNIDDETVAMVGMQIKSFINYIPLLSARLSSI